MKRLMMMGLAALTLGTVTAGRAPAAQGVDAEAGRAALRKLGGG
jgi:hypothetical protein